MKTRIIYFTLLLISINCFGQNSSLLDYNYEIKLEVKNNKVFIQDKDKIDSFRLSNSGTLLLASDTAALISALHFEAGHLIFLQQQYTPSETYSAKKVFDAIIKKAHIAEGNRIIFGNAASSDISNNPTDELVPIATIENAQASPFGMWTWIGLLAGLFGGTLLGFLLAKNKKTTVPVLEKHTDSKNENELLAQTKAELASIKNSLQQQLDFDKQYFEQSFETIVKPLDNALEAKDAATIIPLMIKAMAHYAAITRFKLEKKQSFDLANMQILMKRATYQKSDFPIISGNSSPDNIPNKLKTLIELLQNAKAKDVKDTIVSGYKIENI